MIQKGVHRIFLSWNCCHIMLCNTRPCIYINFPAWSLTGSNKEQVRVWPDSLPWLYPQLPWLPNTGRLQLPAAEPWDVYRYHGTRGNSRGRNHFHAYRGTWLDLWIVSNLIWNVLIMCNFMLVYKNKIKLNEDISSKLQGALYRNMFNIIFTLWNCLWRNKRSYT